MSKVINFNVGGTPTDVPTISNDTPTSRDGVFEGNPPNRCVFTLPDDMNGGGHLRFNGQQIDFLLPPAGWHGEADSLGLPPLVYGAAPSSGLHVEGDKFYTSDGAKWMWRGITHFRLIERTLRGEDIRPLLNQVVDAGGTIVRILSMKTPNTGWRLDPKEGGYAEAVEKTLSTISEARLYCEFTVFADTRDLMPREPDQQIHWVQSVERARKFPSVLVEFMNEYGHGTQAINPLRFSRPEGVLASHGSGLTDAHPVEPLWDFATYHARRDSNAKGFCQYDPFEFEADYPKPCPFIADEGIKPENYGFSLDYAARIGQHAACGAGGTFHWSGGVNSDPMDEQHYACAKAFFRGVQ